MGQSETPGDTPEKRRDREFLDQFSSEHEERAFDELLSIVEEIESVNTFCEDTLADSSIPQNSPAELLQRAAKRSQVRKKRSSPFLIPKLSLLYSEGLCTFHDRMNDEDRRKLLDFCASNLKMKKPFWRNNEWFIKMIFMSPKSPVISLFAPLILLVGGFNGKTVIGMWDGNGNWVVEGFGAIDDYLVCFMLDQPRHLREIEDFLEWPQKKTAE